MDLTRRPLHFLHEATPKKTISSFFDKPPAAPSAPAKKPWKPGMLLPGEAAFTSNAELGARSHQQKLDRTQNRLVTFRTRLGVDTHYSVVASTDKQAVQRARFTYHIAKDWRAVAVDNRPFKDE